MTRSPSRPGRRSISAFTPRRATLALLLCTAACNRGPVRIPPGDGAFDAGVIPGADPADDGGRHPDPEAVGPCDPLALLARLPLEVPGWRAENDPIFPHELIDHRIMGCVGRLFRAPDGRCALVAAGRPFDVRAAQQALFDERLTSNRRGGVTTLSRPSPEADQITTWAFPGDGTVLLVRAFGTTDPETLEPFLATLFPDGGTDAGPGAATADPPDAGSADCPPTAPFADVYDPGAFYSPPGDCRRP